MFGIPRVITLLILTNLFHRHEGGAAPVEVEDSATRNRAAVTIHSPSNHARINNRTVTSGTVEYARQPLEIGNQPVPFRKVEEADHTDEDHTSHDHDESNRKKPYGPVLLATLLVNLVTVIGLTLFLPLVVKKRGHCFHSAFWKSSYGATNGADSTDPTDGPSPPSRVTNIFVPSFAGGALLATTVFLIVPEGQAFIQRAVAASHDGEEDHEDHGGEGGEILSGAVARFGTSLLAGYVLPLLFGILFPQPSGFDGGDGGGTEDGADVEG